VLVSCILEDKLGGCDRLRSVIKIRSQSSFWWCLRLLFGLDGGSNFELGSLLLNASHDAREVSSWAFLVHYFKDCLQLLCSGVELCLNVFDLCSLEKSRLVRWNHVLKALDLFQIFLLLSCLDLGFKAVDGWASFLLISLKVSLFSASAALAEQDLFNLTFCLVLLLWLWLLVLNSCECFFWVLLLLSLFQAANSVWLRAWVHLEAVRLNFLLDTGIEHFWVVERLGLVEAVHPHHWWAHVVLDHLQWL